MVVLLLVSLLLIAAPLLGPADVMAARPSRRPWARPPWRARSGRSGRTSRGRGRRRRARSGPARRRRRGRSRRPTTCRGRARRGRVVRPEDVHRVEVDDRPPAAPAARAGGWANQRAPSSPFSSAVKNTNMSERRGGVSGGRARDGEQGGAAGGVVERAVVDAVLARLRPARPPGGRGGRCRPRTPSRAGGSRAGQDAHHVRTRGERPRHRHVEREPDAERRRPEATPLPVARRARPLVELLAGQREEPPCRRLAHPHLREQARLAALPAAGAISVPSAEAVSTCHG